MPRRAGICRASRHERACCTAYVEFAVQSNFSFLRGASKPEELVVTAALLGHAGMGLADRNTVAGVVRAWSQSKHVKFEGDGAPIKPPYHPGARLVFCDGTPDVLAYPRDRKGWGNLCRLLTEANLRDESPKGDPHLYRADLLEWGDCMSLAVLPDLEADADETLLLLRSLVDRFGRNIRLAVAPAYLGNDDFRLEQAAILAAAAGMRLMAVNDVLYHVAERRPLQDVLTAIRLNVPVSEAGFELRANAERHMKTPVEMARLFRDHPGGARRDDPLRRRAEILARRTQPQLSGGNDRGRRRPADRAGKAHLGRCCPSLPEGHSRKGLGAPAARTRNRRAQEIRTLFPHRA